MEGRWPYVLVHGLKDEELDDGKRIFYCFCGFASVYQGWAEHMVEQGKEVPLDPPPVGWQADPSLLD